MKKWCSILFLIFFIPAMCFAGSQTRSGKSADDIITEARQILNETTASFWTATEMLSWINEGMLDIVSKTHCLEDTATIILSGNTKAYTWTGTSNYLTIDPNGVFYQDKDTSKYTVLTNNKSIIGDVSDTGPPRYWYEFGGKVHVWPVPTTSHSGSTIFVDYVFIPDGCATSGFAIETPEIYDPALVSYVVSRAFLKKRKPEANIYIQLYDQMINRYRADFIEEPKESVKEKTP